MRRVPGLLVSALLLVSSPALAQMEMPQPDWYSIYEEQAKPSAIAEYEQNMKKMIQWMNEKKLDSPHLRWRAFQTDDQRYIYMMDLGELADLQKSFETWMGLWTTMPPEMTKAMSASATRTSDSYGSFLAMRRADLSYMPDSPRVKPEEANYYRQWFYYLLPGKEQEAEAIAKEYAAAFGKAGVRTPFGIWIPTMGADLPLLVVSVPAKDAADMAVVDAEIEKAVGEAELRRLNGRTMSVIRRMDIRNVWPRPDLSRP